MQNFLMSYAFDWQELPAGQFSELAAGCRRDALTGFLRLDGGQKDWLVVFLKGKVIACYAFDESAWKAIPEQVWSAAFASQSLRVGRLETSLDELRVCKLFLALQACQPESARLRIDDFSAQLSQPGAGVCYLKNDSGEHVIVLPNVGIPLLEGCSVSIAGAQFFVASADDLPLPDEEYDVVCFKCDSRYEPWVVHSLRLAFLVFMRLCILRFGDLAGRSLAERLCARLTETSRHFGWEIVLDGGNIVHQHIFSSLSEASQAYSTILHHFLSDASQVIGMRLAKGISEAALLRLNPHQRELLQAYILEVRIPEIDRQPVE